MTVYQLYVESGPQRKKTMVHVAGLLGCTANGPTTEAALARTPAAIRAFLGVLQRHGAAMESAAEVQTEVALHLTEGGWLGNGDPLVDWPGDFDPLTEAERDDLVLRMQWLRDEMLTLVANLAPEQWTEKPATGRTIREIFQHVFGAEYSYLRGAFGKLPEVAGPGKIERMPLADFLGWMAFVHAQEVTQIRALSPAQLSLPITHANTNSRRK